MRFIHLEDDRYVLFITNRVQSASPHLPSRCTLQYVLCKIGQDQSVLASFSVEPDDSKYDVAPSAQLGCGETPLLNSQYKTFYSGTTILNWHM